MHVVTETKSQVTSVLPAASLGLIQPQTKSNKTEYLS